MSRAQETAVRNYMTLLRDPAALRDETAIEQLKTRINEVEDEVERLVLQQELLELEASPADRYVDAFVKHAKAWADSVGVGAEAFAAEGVPDAVLRRAGFSSVDGVRRRGPRPQTQATGASRRRRRAREARALVNEGVQLGDQGRLDEELDAYAAVLSRFGDDAAGAVREQVARALVYRAMTLSSMDRVDEELAAYEEVVARFGEDAAVGVRVQVAVALVNRGVRLGELERVDEELAAYQEVVARFGEDAAVGVREQVARALVYEGMTLDDTGREREASEVFDSVVERFGEDDAEDIRDLVELAGRRGLDPE